MARRFFPQVLLRCGSGPGFVNGSASCCWGSVQGGTCCHFAMLRCLRLQLPFDASDLPRQKGGAQCYTEVSEACHAEPDFGEDPNEHASLVKRVKQAGSQ